MLRRNIIPVWLGIMVLSGMFLMGQETWAPCTCVDNDGDGYGTPECSACPHPELDCDDTNAAVNPGAAEVCDNGIDDDCDGLIDTEDMDCSVASGPLPDTGISLCYDNTQVIECPDSGEPFYGQDAQYTTNPMSYTDNGDGTVTDNVTGLMWQREDDNVTRTWADAIGYCRGLTLAGYTDWRLPNQYELQTIVDYGRYGPAIDTAAFPGTNSNYYYWSSVTIAHQPFSTAWGVLFYDGSVLNGDKTGTGYVRCVR